MRPAMDIVRPGCCKCRDTYRSGSRTKPDRRPCSADDGLIGLKQMLLHQWIGFRRTVCDGVLTPEEIGLVAVVDPGEVSHAVDERCTHADVDTLVSRSRTVTIPFTIGCIELAIQPIQISAVVPE
jgi:hypothetical protein